VALCSSCLAWLGDQLATKAGGFRSVAPVLPVADLERALTHYQALGFGTGRHISGGYGYAHRDGIQIHFSVVAGHDPAGNTAGAYLHVADADALHARWAAADVAGTLTAPTDTDYGLREGAHVDPDGNTVRFGSPIPSLAANVPDGTRFIAGDDALGQAVEGAIHSGDVAQLEELLRDNPGLATAYIGDPTEARSLLHIATDWPGHFPNVANSIAALAAAGADLNARFIGGHTETPLHWAASSNDVAALDALLDAGADIEAGGAVLGDGAPLADATGFGQWDAARRLVERRATTRLKDAAALGMLDRLAEQFATGPAPTAEQVTMALWSASNGGQLDAVRYLAERGADINWVGWDDKAPLDVARDNDAHDVADWLVSQGARSASTGQ
jgi:hypothetical protein